MSNKNKLIIVLMIITSIMFITIQFVIKPQNRKKQIEYNEKQMEATTHDVTAIKECKSKYIGNSSNVINLFSRLPLNNITRKFEINPDKLSLTVNYLDTVRNVGKEKIQRDLVYNTVAAMATIDNLSEVTYKFSKETFIFKREQVEKVFGNNLSQLLKSDIWKVKVQERINSKEFINTFYNSTN